MIWGLNPEISSPSLPWYLPTTLPELLTSFNQKEWFLTEINRRPFSLSRSHCSSISVPVTCSSHSVRGSMWMWHQTCEQRRGFFYQWMLNHTHTRHVHLMCIHRVGSLNLNTQRLPITDWLPVYQCLCMTVNKQRPSSYWSTDGESEPQSWVRQNPHHTAAATLIDIFSNIQAVM